MSISFVNVKSGEKKTVSTEPQIAAYFNSSNLHVNATVGQDLGWRLAPETVQRMRIIRKNPGKMQEIAATFQLPLDSIGDTDVLNWISREDSQKAEVEQDNDDYERQYQDDIRALEESKKPAPKAAEKTETSNKPDSNKQTDSAKIESSNNDSNKEK